MDKIFESFAYHVHDEAMRLAEQSDRLDLHALDTPPQRYLARFSCTGLVQSAGGIVVEADEFHVGIWLPENFLHAVDPFKIVTWLAPGNAFHPQIRPPYICLGRLIPGMPLVDILYQIWSVITYRKVTVREDDALSPQVCAWARRNLERFPVDPRPFKRRSIDFSVEPVETVR